MEEFIQNTISKEEKNNNPPKYNRSNSTRLNSMKLLGQEDFEEMPWGQVCFSSHQSLTFFTIFLQGTAGPVSGGLHPMMVLPRCDAADDSETVLSSSHT